MMRRLQHYLPDVGAIEADLHDESEVLHGLLEDRGEIGRTQRLVQLGLVQHAWPIARHTRWDFTMLLLDIIRRTKDLPGVHIGSKVRLSPALSISSTRELLNCWALLLNTGHLHGTFATESELLFEIRRSNFRIDLENELLASVPSGPGASWARRVLSNERTYQFYQLLAFYRLDRIARGSPQSSSWKLILDRYVSPRPEESPALTKARDLFRRVRRLAFLTLDASLTPTPLEVRLSQLASTPEALERLLVQETWGPREDELTSLEEFLAREIYNGREVLVALSNARPDLRRRLRAGLEKNGLRYVVESAASTDHHAVHRPGPERSRAVVRGVIGGPALTLMLRGNRISLPRRRYEDSFARWSALLGAQASLHIVQNASGSQLVVQTNCHRGDPVDYASAIAGTIQLTERLRKKLAAGVSFEDFDQLVFSGLGKGIIEAALKHFLPNAAHWEWEQPVGRSPVAFGRKADVLAIVERSAEHRKLTRSRRHELGSLRERLSTVQAELVVTAMSNIIAYGSDRVSQIAELDGVVVGVDFGRSDVVLTLVEAKYTKGAELKSANQLKATLAVLGSRSGIRRGAINSTATGRRGQAWIHLRSSYQQ
jgi:hypothetical protein